MGEVKFGTKKKFRKNDFQESFFNRKYLRWGKKKQTFQTRKSFARENTFEGKYLPEKKFIKLFFWKNKIRNLFFSGIFLAC